MTGRHVALIVEDDTAIAEDLVEIVKSLGCDSVLIDNRRDALATLQSRQFCFILLDLEIKGDSDSIKGHTEHGNSLLREIRRAHFDHTGSCFWLPIIIVSGHANEVSAAIEAMKDGANDIIHKPFVARNVSMKIRSTLELSGRANHALCGKRPVAQAEVERLSVGVTLSIPGERIKRRTRVLIGGRPIDLTNSSLMVLLELMVAHEVGEGVHKRRLGASDDQGFKGVSILRDALKPAIGADLTIISNDYHGNYRLTYNVTIGNCATEKLVEIGEARIAELAQELQRRRDSRTKSEGNS